MDRRTLPLYAEKLIRKIAYQLARRPEFRHEDQADLRQELRLDLLRRLPSYRPERARLTTFIDRVVRHRAASLLESRRAAKRGNGRRHVSLHAEIADGEGGATELQDTITQDHYLMWTRGTVRPEQDRLELAIDLERVVALLEAEDRVVCLLLVEMSISDVARTLGAPRSTLYGTIHRLRRAFEQVGLRGYLE